MSTLLCFAAATAHAQYDSEGFDIEPQTIRQYQPAAPMAPVPLRPQNAQGVQPPTTQKPFTTTPSQAPDGTTGTAPIPMQPLPGQRRNHIYTTKDQPEAAIAAPPSPAPATITQPLAASQTTRPAQPVPPASIAAEGSAATTPEENVNAASTAAPATAATTTPAPEAAAPPADSTEAPKPDVSQKHFTSVRLQGLAKITARRQEFDAIIGAVTRFENLEIIPRACWEAPESSQHQESAALLEVWYWKPGDKPALLFFGWMFASSPGLSSLEHAVYDLTVLKCLTEAAPEQPGTDAPAKTDKSDKVADKTTDKKSAKAVSATKESVTPQSDEAVDALNTGD